MHRKSQSQGEDAQRRIERAAQWWGRLRRANGDERAEFAAWLRESPGNLEAYLHTVSLTELIRDLPEDRIAQLAEEHAPEKSNVVGWPQPAAAAAKPAARTWAMRTRAVRGWAALRVAAAGAVVAVLLGMMSGIWNRHGWQDYSTRIAEQRTLDLPDGSRIHLNGHTRLRVRFSGTGREVLLEEGEALFDVARDAMRPFQVHSGLALIRVLGTEFNVTRRPSGTTVSVAEGSVQIAQTRLTAGEAARITPDGQLEKSVPVDVVTVSAWRRHRLVFHADTLEDIAAEFNRYNRTPRLVVIGDSRKARRYSGTFDADDPRSFIGYLRDDEDLALEDQGGELVIRVRAR